MEPAAAAEMVTVTAYREPLGELESPVTTRTLVAGRPADCRAHHHGRKNPPASRSRVVPPLPFAGRQSVVAGDQPARAGLYFGQPHAAYRRRRSAQRPGGRMDPLAGAAGAGRGKHRRGAGRGQRSVWFQRHRRGDERGPPAPVVDAGRVAIQLRHAGHLRREPAGARRSSAPGA